MSKLSDNSVLTGKLLVMTVVMFGFGFLLVPVYEAFCEITGLNGKTDDSAAIVIEQPDTDRLVTVEFVTTLNQGANWEFRPATRSMQVHPGQTYSTTFYARNRAAAPVTAQAVPSVAPGQAAEYLRKTECFCFNRQDFLAGEEKDMPLRFSIDPQLPGHVDTVSLSYTLFDVTTVAVVSAE